MAKKKSASPGGPPVGIPEKAKPSARPPVKVVPKKPVLSATRLGLGEVVAEGGMSVLRAVGDANLLREAVAKIPMPKSEEDKNDLYGRLVEEAQITAQLDHPSIVPVHELGLMADGTPFFIMKWVRGRSLPEQREAWASEPPEKRLLELMKVFLKACDAVAFAHERGVINRDLKPENIMVGDFGEVYVMDWGIAKVLDRQAPPARDEAIGDGVYALHTEEGWIIATLSYASPEQARGENDALDERTDVFGLGAILYWMITGEPLYDGKDASDTAYMAARCEPPALDGGAAVPSWLWKIVTRALAKDPGKRFQSVGDLKKELESFLFRGWRYQARHYTAGSLIVREGEAGEEAFRILKGSCEVLRTVEGRETRVRTMGEDESFGEIAVFTKKPRTVSVRAASDVVLQVVTAEQIASDLAESYWLKLLVEAMAERFRSLDSELAHSNADLADAALVIDVLRYLTARGVDLPDGRREAQWSPLRDALCTFHDKPPEKIEALVERTGRFAVNRRRDVVSVKGLG